MKTILIILLSLLLFCSCDTLPDYSKSEVDTFIATGQAVSLKDSINVVSNTNDKVSSKLPIVKINNIGYYPEYFNGKVYYYSAIVFKNKSDKE